MIRNCPEDKSEKHEDYKIAVAFFGINRSLRQTIESIERNILAPIRAIGTLKTFGHFYNLREIHNPRSGECCSLEASQHHLINFDNLIIDEPNDCLSRFDLTGLFGAKDVYLDDYKSIKNLLHQLHSLDCVTKLIHETYQPHLIIYARPDLLYHNSFENALKLAIGGADRQVYLPDWQRYGGYNDRFAICPKGSAVAYGCRANLVNTYIALRRPLYAELFLFYALHKMNITVSRLEICASRVRSDGRVEDELFSNTSVLANMFLRYKLRLKHWL
jgi:hypothetical protein